MNIQRQCFRAFAMTLLALTAVARAETIYRCGSTYSQTPCTDGKQLDIDDSRDPSRKKEVDAATRRDKQLANQLERERLLRDKAAVSALTKSAQAKKAAPAAVALTSSDTTATLITPKRPKPALYKPKGFNAVVPGSDQKSRNAKRAAPKQGAASR